MKSDGEKSFMQFVIIVFFLICCWMFFSARAGMRSIRGEMKDIRTGYFRVNRELWRIEHGD